MRAIVGLIIPALVCGAVCAGDGRYVEQHKLPGGEMAVIAEGDLEPRSIGSYAVRIYGAANPDFPTDDFVCGVIQPRNGTLEAVRVMDVNGDERGEIVVIVRSAGSGGYLSADAFTYSDRKLVLLRSVTDLPKDADAVARLRDLLGKKAPIK